MWLVLIGLVFWASSGVYGQEGGEVGLFSSDAWMENYTLVITDAKTIEEAYQAAERIEREGGHIGVILPYQVMLGWVPKEKVKSLVGRSKIRGIYQKPLSELEIRKLARSFSRPSINNSLMAASTVDMQVEESQENAIRFFNKVARGDYQLKKAHQKAQREASGAEPSMGPGPGERFAPPINYRDYMYNLIANGITQEDLNKAGIYLRESSSGDLELSPGNSDYMVGKVLFTAIFVESNGGIDPNTYTWTAADRTTIQNEITAGLSWWANTAFNFNTYRTPLTFVISFRSGASTLTSYEPITRPSSDDGLWISQIMANMGYGTGDKFARTTAFNTAMRTSWNTNWATVSFIGYNPSPAPSSWTDGGSAYAYIGGPYSQLLFRNGGWPVTDYDRVNAHETGHLFGARDQYAGSGCNNCTTEVRNGVWNGNCVNCNANSIDSMMKHNSWALDGYLPGQLGWRGVQYLDVATYRVDNGNFKNFFAPGETIQYKIYYCLAGPRVGTTTHTARLRFRAEFYGGSPNSSTTVADDTGWSTWTGPQPPTSTGLSCYWTWWNRTVPAAAVNGPATVSVQLEITQMGKGAANGFAKFHVSAGADTTEPSAEPSFINWFEPLVTLDEGPFMEPAPLPWER
jgi:hypothetical protein